MEAATFDEGATLNLHTVKLQLDPSLLGDGSSDSDVTNASPLVAKLVFNPTVVCQAAESVPVLDVNRKYREVEEDDQQGLKVESHNGFMIV
ncbi:hypothetical protein K2173_013790 [Erythroxylum novogranatense]|uniref:Uncharacterized protein n=1 Tax=Erythroxylum novogranatense TaxID=1862640 RepID=A0AAV8SCG3_9ROSI|nr:hypothetical protein K2173_013790 [Erythroxylum novogranatense]